MIGRKLIALVAIVLPLLAMPVAGSAASCSIPGNSTELNQAAGAALNQFRRSKGQSALRRNATLDKAAQFHACDMARTGKFSHYGKGGSTPGTRMKQAGYCTRYWSENIARGQRSGSEVSKAWANSPGHRRNMLSRKAREYGIAVAMMGGRPAWVMVFADPC